MKRLAILLAACGSATAPPPRPGLGTVGVHIKTTRTAELCGARACTMIELLDCDSSDFGSSPWKGPAFDARGELARPLPAQFVVAYALGYAKLDHLPELDGHTHRAVGAAERTPGLLGYRMGASERCGGAATLSIWESEEAMESFRYSDEHLDAMMTTDTAFYGNGAIHYARERAAGLPSFADSESRLRAELASKPQ